MSTPLRYRPHFLVITFGFLGAAFYYTYRPKKHNKPDAHDCCAVEPAADEARCPPTDNGRFSVMTVNKAVLWIVTGFAVAFLFFPNYVGAFLGADGNTVTENMNRADFKVEGMTCENCATIVATAIRAVPSVQAVEVDYERGLAVVGTEICCPVPSDEILAALAKAGYSGKLVENAIRKPAYSESRPRWGAPSDQPISGDLRAQRQIT